ncbi:MAG TPA: transglycosylase domain-containing protein [Bacteroidales bacterium]|jgi:penicillin-binding protein 1A|nr:transglycosylase domain-containing protein [Bacteroidales bacterium]HPJ05729.1 transglycosylase domain-containing protein [Bacteroidales bacterium]
MRDKKFRKNIIWFWVIISLPALLVLTLFILISANRLGPIPSFGELENPDNSLAAEVYSEDDVLLGKFYIQNRTWTEYEEISPYVIDALIATEDIRFYRHSGIDFRGLVRVLVKTIILGQNTGGGSTITQQLAKNLFLPRDLSHDPAIVRASKLAVAKFKEWQTAVKLEKSYTKEEIITMYLNVFDFIYNAVGINSAARIYFNTTPDSLNIEQSAMLVGMLKNSVAYNPLRNEESALRRRNVVISQMERYGYISHAVADSVSQLPLGIDLREDSHNTGLATYLREYIRSTMNSREPERKSFWSEDQYNDALWRWENDPLYGWCQKNVKPDGTPYNLYRDGLRIYTTINSKMQTYAEEALVEHLSENLQPVFDKRAKYYRNPPWSNDLTSAQVKQIMDRSVRQSDRYQSMRRNGIPEDSITLAFNTPIPMKLFSWNGEVDTVMTPIDSIRYYKYFVRSSFMAMDPHTGQVKAYVGGPDFRYFKYDAVTRQKKQVGSTIKPFLYTLAMQDGYSPCFEVENVARSFELPGDSVPWRPRSSGPEEYHGRMVTLKWGLAQSENYISAWLMKQFSPQAVVDIMHRMGIRSFVDPVYSIFLGTSDLSLEEMVGAYGTFANKGVYTRPLYVTRIEDRNGNIISTFNPYIDEVISEDDAFLMTSLLKGVVTNGTAVRLRLTYKLNNPMGGKTGTTQNHSNGWFMGVMPDLVAGVWTGWEDQAIHFEDLSMGQGANMALPVFGLFLQRLLADEEFAIIGTTDFEAPPGFNVELDCDKVNREQQVNSYRQREY